MTIDVVIPNYNGFDLVKKNLPILIDVLNDYEYTKIIIVDDYSRDEEFKKLQDLVEKNKVKLGSHIKLLRNGKNLGFSSTVNRGIKESNANLVVLLNTDVIPERKFLDPIIEDFASDKNLFGVGFMDKSVEGDNVVLRGRGLASFKKGSLIHKRGEVDRTDTFWISGGSSVVNRDIFEKLGGFDPLFNPFYWEDIDLSYRAKKSGFNIRFESKSVVEHRHLEGAIRKHYTEFQVKTIAYRNQFIFIWKNITDFNLIFSHIFWLPYHIGMSLIRLDFPLILGLVFAVLRLPVIIGKRFEQKKLYKFNDFDLLKSQ